MRHKFTDPVKIIRRPNDIISKVRNKSGVELSYQKSWRSKEKVLEILNGTDEDAYPFMPSLAYMLESCNPGSIVALETDEEDRLLYFFHVFGGFYSRVAILSSGDNC